MELVTNPVVRKILFLTMALSIMQQFTGVNDVLVFSVGSFSHNFEVKYARVLLSGCASLFAFASIFFIDCKPLLRVQAPDPAEGRGRRHAGLQPGYPGNLEHFL
jgi:hypothetical protein